MIDEIKQYALAMNCSNDVLVWLETTGKKTLKQNKTNQTELEHIVDFFMSDQSPNRLYKMSFKDAKRKAHDWTKSNMKKGRNLEDTLNDIEVVHDFPNGSMIVKLKTEQAFKREGFLMSHCLGGYNPNNSELEIYSYRDDKNMPHATFEVRKNSNEITQIKGKGNGPIHPKYIEPILTFLEILGIDIRPSEMVNLGYYHIDNEHLDFLKSIPSAAKQIHEVRGKFYAV